MTRDGEVENELEGCCSARLAAHFVEQPAGTTTNSEEGGSLLEFLGVHGRWSAELLRSGAKGEQGLAAMNRGAAAGAMDVDLVEVDPRSFCAQGGKTGARERCAGRRDCWPEMEFGLQQRGLDHGKSREGEAAC